MSKLTEIQEAVAQLTDNEIRHLTIWLMARCSPYSQADNAEQPNPFGAVIIAGSTSKGKSAMSDKLSGKQP